MAIAPMFKEGFGAETEYAPQPVPALTEEDRCYTPRLFNHGAISNPKSFAEFGLVAGSAPYIGHNLHLLNGGRIYPANSSGKRVEYATPECRTLDEIVYAVLAGNYIMPHIFNTLDKYKGQPHPSYKLQPPHRHTLIASNADHAGNEFTTIHENYTVPPYTLHPDHIFELMMPFFVSRQLYTGAGYISPHGGFYLSPAAIGNKFDSHVHARERLHLQVGDFNMSPDVIRLKFGATLCLLETIYQGWRPSKTISDLDDAQLINFSITKSMMKPKQAKYQIVSGGEAQGKRWVFNHPKGKQYSALDIQYECLDAIDRYLGHDPNPDIQWVRKVLRTTLDALGKDDIKAPWLDWTVKYDQYQKLIGDGSPEKINDLVKLDRAYHYWDMTNRQASVYPLLAAVHPDRKKIIAAMTTPPQTTRAKVRGEFVQQLLQKGPNSFVGIDWQSIRYQSEIIYLTIDQTTSPELDALV